MRRVLLLLMALVAAPAATAHEVRPAYLHLQQTSAEEYDLLWRVPARGEMRLALYGALPESCRNRGKVRNWQQNDAFM